MGDAQIGEMVERLNHAATEMEARDKVNAELRVEIAELLQDRESIRRRWDGDRSTYESDRSGLAAKYAAQSAHWAIEVDRARQALKLVQEQHAKVEKDAAGQSRDLSTRLKESKRQAREHSDLHAHTRAEFGKLQPKHAAAMESLDELRLRLKDRETQWAEQIHLLQTQLANALAQLAAKDQEHGELLRSLVANSASPPVRRSSRQPRAS
jgi:chromosome segregation ATPase